MSDFLARISHFSPKRLALLADELNRRVEELEHSGRGAVAIVGIGCRFPGGADTPDKLWQLLRDGRDAITEVPPERWAVEEFFDPDPDCPGKMSTRFGGFIGPVDGFDPHFFGISPREAHSMDPQQRVLLEVVWRALEDAAIAPAALEDSRTGVFLGMSAADYFGRLRANGVDGFDAYTASGIAHSIASGRVAYALGLRGPALSIDTACSSSLVAIYQAMQSLRRRECDVALAGGVNLILEPDITIALSRSHMMAPDGRCKAFDARADGFVRGEGCGMLVLKRLADARADGDRIVAVIRGGAINQDGRSNGLTAPNGPSQEAVLREALADAGVAPAEVGFVEAHGTGTSLGDPIEVQALARIVGAGRPAADPCLVGSIKANIGHLEAAAGVASVVKLALALRHREIPGQIHFHQPNPHIPWQELPLRIPTGPTPWPAPARGRRLGGVSSFGFSGTNVHLVLEEAPAPEVEAARDGAADRPAHLLTVSARNETALRELATAYRDALSIPGASLADVAFTANAGRSHFAHRAAVGATTAAEAAGKLARFLNGESAAGMVSGVAGTRPPRVAFLFTGQGAQYAGMARQLYDTQPVFRQAVEECDSLLQGVLPRPLLSVLYPEDGASSPIDETEYTQPALFAVEYALARMWMSWGVTPSAVLGHSVGEYVAACLAGVFTLQDGLRLVAERGRLMGALPAGGAMAAVAADEARVRAAMAPWSDAVSIAAVNGPVNTVVSGKAEAVEALVAELAAAGTGATRLKVSHAFHSLLVEPMVDAFAAVAATVRFETPRIEIISNVTGKVAGDEIATPGYWCEHVRAAVRFAPAMKTLADSGCQVFLELGPQPVLLGMGRQCLGGDAATWLPSLRRGRGDWDQVLESLAGLYAAGVGLDWSAFDAGYHRKRVDLPGYPFQRDRYWIEAKSTAGTASRTYAHPLLGWEVPHSLNDHRLFESHFDTARLPYLEDHRILGQVLLPSPVYLEMTRAAAADPERGGAVVIEDFTIHQALPIDGNRPAQVQFALAPPADGPRPFRISALDQSSGRWRTQAAGTVTRAVGTAPRIDLDAVRERVTEPVSVEDYYRWLGTLGLDFGGRFRGAASIARREGEVLAEMRIPEPLVPGLDKYGLHPALLDSCFHVIGAALPGGGVGLEEAFLLLNIERVVLYRPLGQVAWNHVVLDPASQSTAGTRETFRADLRLIDADGQVIAEFEGMHFKRARPGSLAGGRLPGRVGDMLYDVTWRDAPLRRMPAPARIQEGAQADITGLSERYQLSRYGEFLPRLDHLAAEYIVRALRDLGFGFEQGRRFEADALGAESGVLPGHRRLFARMMAVLEEDGILRQEGGAFTVARVPPAGDPEGLAEQLLADHPEAAAEVNLTRRCARELAAVLRGRADPLALLFPGGSLADAEKLYQDSPPARAYNGLIGRIAEIAAGDSPDDRPLRILEIGAGTGSTTAFVLPALGTRRVEYTFTDVSPLFLNRAREKFKGHPVTRYGLLDIGRPPVEQGFAAGGYDIVIGANVLHATPDLDVTMANVSALLAPGGLVVLLEGTVPQRFGDLTVGLLDGWWAYTDTDRRQYALMPRANWLELLARHGLAGGLALPGETSHPVLSQQAVFVAQAPSGGLAGRWLIIPDASGHASAVAEALEGRGARAEVLPASGGQALGRAVAAALTDGEPVRAVVHLAGVGTGVSEATSTEALLAGGQDLLGGLLETVKAIAGAAAGPPPQLILVTQGGQPVDPAQGADPLQATLWGLSHVVAIEHPELRCRRIDLDPAGSPESAVATIVAQLEAGGDEDQVAVRGGRRLCRRLVRSPAGREQSAVAAVIRPDASYLVTGGLRGLGPRVAAWLAERGARHLVLMGRRPPQLPSDWIERLKASGVTVLVVTGDVANPVDVENMLAQVSAGMPPLAGVVHSAGSLDDGVLTSLTWPRFASVLAAKVAGSWNLHRLAGPLDFMVLFSSGASVAGSAGQANHAAANAFEDALAWYRQARGMPAVSINWGPWGEIGAAVDRGLSKPGFLDLIAPADGLMALEVALRRTDDGCLLRSAQMAVLAADWSRLDRAGAGLRDSRLFSELATTAAGDPAAGTEPSARSGRSLRDRLAETAPNRRRVVLRDHIRELTARVLGLPRPEGLNVEEPLRQLGLDSLMAVELRNLLGKAVEQVLPATVTFDHPSVAALTAHLAETVFVRELAADQSAAMAESAEPVDSQSADDLARLLTERLANLGNRESL